MRCLLTSTLFPYTTLFRSRERDPGIRRHGLPRDLRRVVEPDREGRARDRRREEQVVLLEEPPRVLPPREPVEPGLHVLRRRVLQRGLDDPVEPGIDLALAVEVGRQARGDAAAEELAPAVERRGPARIDGLDAAADLAEG